MYLHNLPLLFTAKTSVVEQKQGTYAKPVIKGNKADISMNM